jgi:hypothetical protein
MDERDVLDIDPKQVKPADLWRPAQPPGDLPRELGLDPAIVDSDPASS